MSFKPGFRLRLLLSGALVATTVSPAFAQTAPAAEQAVPGGEQSEGGHIEEIVVTATKRETNLQETPISMAVLGTVALKDRHVQSIYDLADGTVPSLRVATFEARQSALTIGIRGIVPLDANQPAREQGVGIYIDGIYLGRQHGLNAALFDIERVEVLKGPQGTLFGRNTEGGALSIVSAAPTGEFGGRVSGSIGNLGSHTVDAHVNLPSIAGFSIKLDGVKQYQSPVTKNPMSGETGWGYYDRQGFRAAVRWTNDNGITNDFSFDIATSNAVIGLGAVDPRPAISFGHPERLRHLPRRPVRDADIAHQSLTHEIVEHAQRFVERCDRIVAVDLIEIDIVELQALKACFHRIENMSP